MKPKAYILAAFAALTLVIVGCDKNTSGGSAEGGNGEELDSLNEKISYVFGYSIGQQFKSQQIDLDTDIVAQAIEDVYNEAEPRLTDQQMQTAMEEFQAQYEEQMAASQAEQQAEQEAAAAENKAAGEEFLAANAEKEGVETLPSGLQYKAIETGDGEQPEATDTVKVHYRGTLIDGTEFDSSYERGEPATFPLQNVIPGWTEGLQQMREGAKYELYVPSDLAYGPGGSGPVIGPNETLIFEVELLEVVSGDENAETEAEAQ